jgi:uncharacterized protein
MIYLVLLILVGAAILLPQYWVRRTLDRHGADRPDLDGTGAELAQHLIERFGLDGVRVERTDRGDHYDPDARVVRLVPAHHDGRSIAAAAVAAHEVGHAMQHAGGERMLAARQRLVKFAMVCDRLGSFAIFAAPIVGVVARTPLAIAAFAGVGLALMAVRVAVNLVTLPVEYDASFGKALPVLREGGYLDENDLPAARSVLRAAAFTYLAGALLSLVNLARWFRMLR